MDDGSQGTGWFGFVYLAAAYPIFKLLDIIGSWVIGLLGWQDKKIKEHTFGLEATMSEFRQGVADHKDKSDRHFAVLEDRVAENYEEFLKFQTQVAKELATKTDLDATERRIINHIDRRANGK